jgi:hypothetical protein
VDSGAAAGTDVDLSGPVVVNRDDTVTIRILAKPGAKHNSVTGRVIKGK